MGLLDDAIREHLELKRRRGADPDEVARQEDEALGDPRRGEFAQPDAPAAVAAGEPPEPVDAPAPEPEAAPPAPPAPRDEPWLEDEPVAPPPPPPEPAPRAEPAAADVGQPTAEFAPFDVERDDEPEAAPREPEADVVRPDEEPAADEDVLEETPDFLQETPEHDRLWFEQKPPRDFDFDN